MAGASPRSPAACSAGERAAGARAWRRLASLPRSAYGTALAHFGVGMMVVGIVATSAYQSERILVMKPGERVEIAGYELTFRGVAPGQGPELPRGGRRVRRDARRRGRDAARARRSASTTRRRSRRRKPASTTPGAAISTSCSATRRRTAAMRCALYFNPLVRFIWIGALIMFLGGALSLSRPPPARRRAAPGRRGCRRRCRGVSEMTCARKMRALAHCRRRRLGARHAGAGGRAGRDPVRLRRSRRARARSRPDCAASSARTSRSTTATRRWRAICACSCASG